MDYASEQSKALTLAVVVGEAIVQLRELHEHYPHLVKAVFQVLYGVMVEFEGECPSCGCTISVNLESPIGGLINACESVDQALVLLGIETELSGGGEVGEQEASEVDAGGV